MIESQILEFKRQINDDFVKEIIAFLNTNDGVIYVGIDDSGNVIGLNNVNKEQERISNIVSDNINPNAISNIKIDIEKIDKKNVIKLTIKEGYDKPYYKKSAGIYEGTYIRSGSTSRKINEEYFKEMIRKTSKISYEEKIAKNQNLTFNMTSIFFKNHDIPFEENNKRTLGIIDNEKNYTNLGYFLSDQFDICTKILLYNSKEEENLIRIKEFNGSLIFQTDSILNFFSAYNEIKTKFINNIRINVPSYPEVALREVIENSIIHTDYEKKSGVTIKIFEDRLEIISIGGLVENIKKSEIFKGISILRNKKLGDIYYKLGYIERYGTGINKILNAYKNQKMQPDFLISDNIFKVTLYNQNYYDYINNESDYLKKSSLNQFIDEAICDLEKARIAYYKNDFDLDSNFSILKNIPMNKVEYIDKKGLNDLKSTKKN